MANSTQEARSSQRLTQESTHVSLNVRSLETTQYTPLLRPQPSENKCRELAKTLAKRSLPAAAIISFSIRKIEGDEEESENPTRLGFEGLGLLFGAALMLEKCAKWVVVDRFSCFRRNGQVN